MGGERQICTFQVAGKWFGLDVLKVQEIVCAQPLTRVPLAPAMVAGLMNLRGQIVPAIDLRRRLGLADRADGGDLINVVVEAADGAVSLIVDEVGDVIELKEESLERAPEGLRGAARDLVEAVCKQPDRLIVILSPERVLEIAEARG